MPTPDFQTLLYTTAGPVATITLNRPEQLNTIVPPMPDAHPLELCVAERRRCRLVARAYPIQRFRTGDVLEP